MNALNLVPCGIPGCHRSAMNGAIFGTQRFCLVPAMSAVKTELPLLRYNLCDLHLNDVRSNFEEIYHDAQSSDFSDVAAFV